MCFRPRGGQQFLFRDEAAGIPDQVLQDGERLGSNGEPLVALPQDLFASFDAKRPKNEPAVLHVRRNLEARFYQN